MPFPFHCQHVGARHLERSSFGCRCWGIACRKLAAHRTSVCEFCKTQPIGPQKLAALMPHSIREQSVFLGKNKSMSDVFLA